MDESLGSFKIINQSDETKVDQEINNSFHWVNVETNHEVRYTLVENTSTYTMHEHKIRV